jgi:hypothetical protein
LASTFFSGLLQSIVKKHLIVYAKRPLPGYAKTRLGAKIGREASAGVYARFLYRCLLELIDLDRDELNIELAGIIVEPIKVFSSMADLIARYQQEGVLKSEHPLHALAALLGPLMYSSLARGAISDPPVPVLDLSNHVACYLDGRRI